MAGNYDDMPFVGDFGRQLLACSTAEEAKALIGSGETPAAVTVDNIQGATDLGRTLMKAANAEAARTAIGAAAAAAQS